ncbi:MAG TPA: hypothetical protein VFR67_06075 [Pilimelia sp.]|nr:hypothetical protein [Pilimelia sp.]
MDTFVAYRRPIAQPTYAAVTVPAFPVVRTAPAPADLVLGDWSIRWTAVDRLLAALLLWSGCCGAHRRTRGAVRRRGMTLRRADQALTFAAYALLSAVPWLAALTGWESM